MNDYLDKLSQVSRGMYFRRDGTPYKDVIEWALDYEKDEMKHVDKTTLWWGGLVSTVWLGLNHNYYGGKPLIFETMVFKRNSLNELDMERYSTEAEAKAGHARMVRRWRFPIWNLKRLFE